MRTKPETETNITVEEPPPTTQEQLDRGKANHERISARRAELEREIAEAKSETASLAGRVVAGDADALQRSRARRDSITDAQIQIESCDTVLKSVGEEIARLSALRRQEMQMEAQEIALRRVQKIEGDITEALGQLFAGATTLLDAYRSVNAGLKELRSRDEYTAAARGERESFAKIEAARRALLDQFAVQHGGLSNVTFPLWLFDLRPITG